MSYTQEFTPHPGVVTPVGQSKCQVTVHRDALGRRGLGTPRRLRLRSRESFQAWGFPPEADSPGCRVTCGAAFSRWGRRVLGFVWHVSSAVGRVQWGLSGPEHRSPWKSHFYPEELR